MNHNHDHEECGGCAVCALINEGFTEDEANRIVSARDAACMDKFGWYAHLVQVDPHSPTGYNCHTHGVVESWEHPDFQIVLPLSPENAHGVLCVLIDRIKHGEQFESGQIVDRIVDGYSVLFSEAKECDRTVLRVIFPSKDGILPPTGPNALQLQGTDQSEGITLN